MIEIVQEKKDEVMIVRLKGELDVQSSGEAEEKVMKLIESGEEILVLDLMNVEYLTSAGLRFLLAAHYAIEEKDGKFAVCTAHPDVTDVLHMSGMDRMIRCCQSESEAVEAVRESQS